MSIKLLDRDLLDLERDLKRRNVAQDPPEGCAPPPGVMTPAMLRLEVIAILQRYGNPCRVKVRVDDKDPRNWKIHFLRDGQEMQSVDELYDVLVKGEWRHKSGR